MQKTSPSLSQIFESVRDDLERVDREFARQVQSQVDLIPKIGKYIQTSGGKRIAPDPMPWEAFSSFVRSTNRTMPPYSEAILSDGDLADIYAYLQLIPKPPDANSLPLLKP